jgi:hypothetical protein
MRHTRSLSMLALSLAIAGGAFSPRFLDDLGR